MQSGGYQSRKFLILADEDLDPGPASGELYLLLVEFSTMQLSPGKKKNLRPGCHETDSLHHTNCGEIVAVVFSLRFSEQFSA
jgi:hypothetical protein